MNAVRGTVINIHHHGATVRLDDGTLASVSATDLASHRATYEGSHTARIALDLLLERRGRHAVAMLEATPVREPGRAEPQLANAVFETQINAYLKSTEVWAPPDRPAPAERHFIRKKRREAIFEARKQTT